MKRRVYHWTTVRPRYCRTRHLFEDVSAPPWGGSFLRTAACGKTFELTDYEWPCSGVPDCKRCEAIAEKNKP